MECSQASAGNPLVSSRLRHFLVCVYSARTNELHRLHQLPGLRHECISLALIGHTFPAGEALPFQNACAGLVVCFNVLDHVSNAPQVVREISRILRPGGLFFLGVDTFSYLGLAKWYLWTKPRHANEILVRAHPYRFLERHVKKLCRAAGFQRVRTMPRTPIDLLLGHSVLTPFLFRKS